MASVLLQDLLRRKKGEVEEFIEQACAIVIDAQGSPSEGKDSAACAPLSIAEKNGDICDVIILIADLISDLECKAVTDVLGLQDLLRTVCYPVICGPSDKLTQMSNGNPKDDGSKIVHSICWLVAVYIKKSRQDDPVAMGIISGIKGAVCDNLEGSNSLSSIMMGHEDHGSESSSWISPNFHILSALEILEHIQDSQACNLLEEEWFREVVSGAIQSLESVEPVICARLCGIIMKEGLTTHRILEEVWQKVKEMHQRSQAISSAPKDKGSNIYLVLCVLANATLSPGERDSSATLMFYSDVTFWMIIQQGLLCHIDPLTRKRAMFLLKRTLEVVRSRKDPFSVTCRPRETDESPIIWWSPDNDSKLLQIWNDFVLFYEALGEVQTHVVQPVLAKWATLLNAAKSDEEGKPYLHTSWLCVLLERSFKHEGKTVTRWGVEQALLLDVTNIPLMTQGGDKFLFGPLLSVLREPYLYTTCRTDSTTHLDQRPLVAVQTEALLNKLLSQLSYEQKQEFHRNLVTGICKLMWGPVPLTLLLESVSGLPECPAWGTQQLYDFREVLQSSVLVFPPAVRSCIQVFLSLATIRLVDVSSVPLHEVFTFLAALNASGTLKRGEHVWQQICNWLSMNRNTEAFLSGAGSCAKDLKDKITGDPSEDNASSLHEVEVDRLALEILMLADVHSQESGNGSNCRAVLGTLTVPLREVLCTVGNRIYLPPGQADRSIQVLTAITGIVLNSTRTDNKDPVVQELNTILNETAAEIFIYLMRRIFSLDVSKAESLDKVHTYLDLLSTLNSYCSTVESSGVLQATAQLESFKKTLVKDCPAVLISSSEAESTQDLFRSYVSIELISWRLNCSHSDKGIFQAQELYSTILHLEISALHDNKKSSSVGERDSTGPLIGIFLGRKWSCIHRFLEAGHVTADYEGALRRCIDELSLVSDTNSTLIMDCAAFLLRKLVSSSPDLCCEAVTAAWCCVMDFYRNKHFWELYSAFVDMTFQHELLTQGPETPLFNTIQKIFEFILIKGETKLGLLNLVVSNVCRSWQQLIVEGQHTAEVIKAMTNYTYSLRKSVLFGSMKRTGRLEEELLLYLSTNDTLGSLKGTLTTTSIERDPALVRVAVINLLIRLGETKSPESQTFLVHFLQSLLEEEKAVTPEKKCYVLNSQVHRIKQRVWQAALVVINYIPQESSNAIFKQILIQLASENQSSAKHMMEWLVVLMIHRFPSTVEQFWARLDQMIEGSRCGFSPILIIMSQLGAVQPSREAKVSFYNKAVPIIFPWSLAPTVSLRVQSQVALFKIWLDCRRDGLTEVLDRYPTLNACMEYNENRGSAITNKMEGNFFLKDFHPLLDYSLETIFQSLPYLTLVIDDELVIPDLFLQESPDLWGDDSVKSIALFNSRETLRLAQKLGTAADKRKSVIPKSSVDLSVIDFKERPLPLGGGDVQKKITPLREELAPGFEESDPTTEANKGQLVVVATLVDRMPNLGGLCRTGEIFGVERLVIGSARYLEDKSFLGLSVTAEKWLPIKEVRPSELKDYLTEMRHQGYTLVGLEQTANSIQINDYRFPAKTLILLGNERTGIPVELIHHLDVCVEIPQLGYIRSLNVHVSGALLIWEYTRQMLGLG